MWAIRSLRAFAPAVDAGLGFEGARCFGTKRVRQRRRSRGRIIQLKETHYEPKPEGYQPLPLSLLASGPIRRVLATRTVEAKRLVGVIDWERYKCNVKEVFDGMLSAGPPSRCAGTIPAGPGQK
ncbi:unnamed protein product [Effrenium voratum]|nr:unnamed protein product [Effrenium voratum]